MRLMRKEKLLRSSVESAESTSSSMQTAFIGALTPDSGDLKVSFQI